METRKESQEAFAANDQALNPATQPTSEAADKRVIAEEVTEGANPELQAREAAEEAAARAAAAAETAEAAEAVTAKIAPAEEAGAAYETAVEAAQAQEPATAQAQEPATDAEAIARSAEDEEAADADVKTTAPRFASKAELLEMLEQLAAEADAEVSRDDLARFKQQFYAFRKAELEAELEAFIAAGNAETDFLPASDPDEDRFKELINTIKDAKAARQAARDEEQRANLERKRALIDELVALAADTDNVNRAFPRVKEIQAEFKTIGDVPQTDATDLWKAYQQATEQFYDQLKINQELRDYDFRKNLELKTLLCEEAEKLDQEEDIVLAFKRLQNLHDEWRQTGPVAKENREEIWARFKDASAVVNKKYQAFFEERKAKEAANEAAKTAICEKVEAIDYSDLRSFAAWEEVTKQFIAAQEEWKTVGYANRKTNNALFSRFRQACDKFFAAKSEYYRSVKDELASNLAKKIALCEKAEQLATSTDWKKTADALVALQKEWKTIGTVSKKHSDAVWERFQKACDTFFENRKRNMSDSRSAEQANLKAKREIIEALRAIPADTPRAEALTQVKELQAKWQEIGHVPFREKDKVYDEYRAVCDAFYTRNRDNRGGMSRFEDVIKEMGSDENKLYRERDRIMRAYEIKRNELKTYENNLGFLSSKSKAGASMVKEMERRIQLIKDDLAAIEQKIKLIDSKL